ncbi:MAG TPA: hypothetical protein VF902_00520 [Coriobacteriia bacterium]
MRLVRNTRVRRGVALVLVVALLVFATPDVAVARTPRWIRQIGHVAGHIVNAPGRVANWATRWMGPVLGPVAAMWLSGRITSNGDIARIVGRAGNVQRAAQDAQFLGDSADRLRQVYRSEAEANRKLADQIDQLARDMKADGIRSDDVDRLFDLRLMQQRYRDMADRLDRRANGIGTKDVVDLFTKSAVRRLLGSGQEALVGALQDEVRKLVNRDVLIVLDGDGLDPRTVFEGIVQRDAQRMLEGTDHAGDKNFEDRLREALKEKLKQDKEFLRRNWRPEVERLIAQIEQKLKAERGQEPTRTADQSTEASSEEQIGVDPGQVTDEILPGEGAEGLEALPGTPKDQQWVVWVAEEVGYKPICINTLADFEKPTRGDGFPGGGTSATPIKKKKVGGPFRSLDEARRWVDPQLTDIGFLSGIYAGMYVAKFQGETHNIELIGFDPQKYP